MTGQDRTGQDRTGQDRQEWGQVTAGRDAGRDRALHRELSRTRAGHGSGKDRGQIIQVREKIGHKRTVMTEKTGHNRTGQEKANGDADRVDGSVKKDTVHRTRFRWR